MANKQQVIDANKAHPDWTARQLAEYLDCLPEYVRATARRNGLTLAKSRSLAAKTPSELRSMAGRLLDRAARLEAKQ